MFKTIYNSDLKEWSGPNTIPTYNPKISIGQVLLETLKKNPNKIGQISTNGIELSNIEIRQKSIKAAVSLTKKFNLKVNDVCAFYTKNTPFLAPVIFAAFTIGAPVNGLNPWYKKSEIIHMLQLTKPKIAFCDWDNADILLDAIKELNWNITIFCFGKPIFGTKNVDELFDETIDTQGFIYPDIEDGSKLPALIICTSGTTGTPKGVKLSHAQVLEYISNINDFTSDEVIFSFSPIYWITGICQFIMGTLYGTVRIITDQPYSPELFVEVVEKYKVTLVQIPPYILTTLLNCPLANSSRLSTLKYSIIGGSALSTELINSFNKLLRNGKVYPIYGMSEAGGAIATTYPYNRLGSLGQLAAGIAIKVIDENGSRCGVGEAGEICIKRMFNFLGYCENEKNSYKVQDSEGFFHTADMGYFDADGFLYLIDRKKDLLKYQNFQVSPLELENVIITGHNGVSNVCVVGIPHAVSTHLPAAVIIKKFGFDVKEEEILKLVANNLSDAKQLRGGVYFMDKFPVNSNGKILRNEVLEIAHTEYKLRQKKKLNHIN